MSFRDFFGVRHGGYQPKADAEAKEPSSAPKGPPPTTGSGVQPPEMVVGRVAFGPPGVTAGQLDVGASASFRGRVGDRPPTRSAEELAAQRDAFEKRKAEQEAEMKRQVREVLVERAALAILQGLFANSDLEKTPARIWAEAERFVDAREAGAELYRLKRAQ
jgi:hypothetical protein